MELRLLLPHLLLRLVHQSQNLLCPAAEEHAVRGEHDPPALVLKESSAQLILHLGQLPAQGGLGDVQHIGGPGDRLLSRHREKIAQYPQFHRMPPSNRLYALIIHETCSERKGISL